MATEYDGSGATRFEATIAGGTYRTYRFDWTGAPVTKPDLVASGTGPNVTLSVSWNGDDRTANRRFSSGDTAGSLTPAKTVARTDFEVSTTIPRRAYAVAQALDAEGRVIGQSAPVPTGGPFREVAVPPVDGSYRPIVGDFAGSRNDDVVYYRPGSGADHLHIADGDGGFRSIVLPPISGDYETLVGDFVGDDRDDIVFYRRGSAVAYLWRLDGEDRGQDVAVTSAAMLVPTKVTKALVLDNRAPYGGPRDEILWYAAGRSPDRIDHLGWPSDGPLTMTSRAITVNGTFQPVAGDFDGNGFADVFWYAPGPATDHLWFLSGTETRSRSQTSVPAPVRGTYTPLVGNLVGSADNLELAFIAPGPGADSVWTFGASGAHASRDVTTSLSGTPIVLQGTPDRVLLWVPGFAPWVESIDPFGTQPVGGSSFDARYRPLVGDFTGAGGTASILWYAPGSAPERLSRAD
jgi:hypothetical protein